MTFESDTSVTALLNKVCQGDKDARGNLYRLVENDLRIIARQRIREQRPDHTLETTVLVDDVMVKLAREDMNIDWQDRKHFYRVAARAMRNLLIDHERGRRAERRGGKKPPTRQQRSRSKSPSRNQVLIFWLWMKL